MRILLSRSVGVVFWALTTLPLYSYSRLVGQARLDSLFAELPHAKSDTSRFNILNSIAFTYASVDPNKGLEYGIEALRIAQQMRWEYGLACIYTSIGQNYINKSAWDSAIFYCEQSLKLHEESGNQRSIAITLNTIGDAYSSQSDFSLSLEYQFKSLKIFEELKEKKLIATCLMNIGTTYLKMGDAKSTQYTLDALKIFEELGDKHGLAEVYLAVGSAYYQQKDYKQAIEYFNKSLSFSRDNGQMLRCVMASGNIGSAYGEMGNFPLALTYAFKTLELSRQMGDKVGEFVEMAEIGKTYLSLAKMENRSGLPDSLAGISKDVYLQKSMHYLSNSIANNGGTDLESLQQCLLQISEAYEMNGNLKKAFESYKQYAKLKDSVFSEDNKVKIAKHETQRETDLKEKQIEINRLSKVDFNRKMQLLVLGIVFLSIVTGLTIRSGRKEKAARERAEKWQKELEDTLLQKNQLMEKLAESADMKSKFFANISHELRTPVTILTGMLDLMKHNGGGGVDKNRLEVAFNSSRRLQHMVEEILDLSKLDKPGNNVKYEIKEIAPVIRRMTDAFSSYAGQAKLSLSFEAKALELVFIVTDVEKLEKIITNLIYNAIKFTPEHGSISVSATLTADKQFVSIAVSDTGIGINEKDLPHIFDRFYQSESSGSKDQGSGIGLSLVHELTALLNGRIEVSSKLGAGTTFTLYFPVFNEAVPETIAEMETFTERVDLQFSNQYTILLVEDNPEMRYYIKETLSGSIKLVEVANGKQALEWLSDNRADMVITDIMMPEMDGRMLISTLKRDDKYKKIPIITVSALADQESQLTMLRLGIDDYIVKPFNPSELRIRVRNLLLNLEERNAFNQQLPEPDDIPVDSGKAAEFKKRLQDFVLTRMKNYDVTVYDVAYEFSLSERQLYRLSKSLTGFMPHN